MFTISIHALREEGDSHPSANLPSSINFYPRPPRGGRPINSLLVNGREIFLSTPSARRATYILEQHEILVGISIHALREEGDWKLVLRTLQGFDFYPRPPRGGRRPVRVGDLSNIEISIHALREEGDQGSTGQSCRNAHFYPRPPRGGRHLVPVDVTLPSGFLSTPSARRATAKTEKNISAFVSL